MATTQINYLVITRNNVLNLVNKLSVEQLNKIPAGYNNNLIWNFGHLLVTQQLLCYGLSEIAMNVPSKWIEKYRKGTRPQEIISSEEIREIKSLFLEMPKMLTADYEKGIFQNYSTYETSFGITIHNIEQAITFNNIHEGMHLGYMMAMRKQIID